MSGTEAPERHVEEVVERKPRLNRKQAGAAMIVGVLAVGAIAMSMAGGQKKPTEETAPAEIKMGRPEVITPPAEAKVVPATFATPMPPLPPAPAPTTASTPVLPASTVAAKAPAPPKLLIYAASAPAAPAASPSAPGSTPTQQPDSELGAALKPTELEGSAATVLPHPEMVITQGTMMPCVMDVALDSQLPGFVTCHLSQDVYGTTGTVKLLDRGTKITGEVRSGGNVRQGQNRVAVLWLRAETPYHVIIKLASPATDALGRSGIVGDVDNHFWKRFGSALLFSLIESGTQIGSSALQAQGGVNLNFGGASGAAQQALGGNTNIPPTITVPQGATVAVMTARDLDFAKVYSLGTASR